MLKNPYLNALFAGIYIILIVLLINLIATPGNGKSLLIPMVVLSLFVISASVMAIIFFYEPMQLYLAGNKTGAWHFFAKTLVTFICFAVILLLLLQLKLFI